MPDTNAKTQVLRAISQVMGVPVEELSEASSPDSIEPWDSLKHMTLVLALEEEFGVQFSDDQIMAMTDVGLILSAVGELLS